MDKSFTDVINKLEENMGEDSRYIKQLEDMVGKLLEVIIAKDELINLLSKYLDENKKNQLESRIKTIIDKVYKLQNESYDIWL